MDAAAQALYDRADFLRRNGDGLELERAAHELIELGNSRGQADARAWGRYFLGIAMWHSARGDEAIRLTREAIELLEAAGEPLGAARAKMNLAALEFDFNVNPRAARRLYEESIATIRECGEPFRLAIALGNLSEIVRFEGDYAGAIGLATEARDIFEQAGDETSVGVQLTNIALCQSLLRADAASMETLRDARRALTQGPVPRWVAHFFDTAFIMAVRSGRIETAAQLLGFVELFRFENNVRRLYNLMAYFSSAQERVDRELPEDRRGELVNMGEALSLEEAFALATH